LGGCGSEKVLRGCKSSERVFDETLFPNNFAKLATKRFSCFAKMRNKFHNFYKFRETDDIPKKTSFAKTDKVFFCKNVMELVGD
jgi:hypothetical protein